MKFTNDTAPFSVDIAGTSIDVLALPDASIRAMLSRGLTHFFGSEVASRVKARADKFAEDHKADADGAKVWGDDEIAQEKKNVLGEFVTKLTEGTVGTRAVGVTVDPVEVIMRRLARQSVLITIKTNGWKVPKKDEGITFPNGAVKSMDEMIATRLDPATIDRATCKVGPDGKIDLSTGTSYVEGFRKEAEAEVKRQAKAKAKAETAIINGGNTTADELGL